MRQDWVWDGGRPCVDLLNTLRDRRIGGRELLVRPADLVEWLALAVPTGRRATADEIQLETARTLREAIDRVIVARAGGVRPKTTDLVVINRCARAYQPPPPQLTVDRSGALWAHTDDPDDPIGHALGTVAIDAVHLLAADPFPLVRECAAENCGLRFVDQSPARNRQWCSMSRCGNRAKARQHYARRRAAATGTQ